MMALCTVRLKLARSMWHTVPILVGEFFLVGMGAKISMWTSFTSFTWSTTTSTCTNNIPVHSSDILQTFGFQDFNFICNDDLQHKLCIVHKKCPFINGYPNCHQSVGWFIFIVVCLKWAHRSTPHFEIWNECFEYLYRVCLPSMRIVLFDIMPQAPKKTGLCLRLCDSIGWAETLAECQ